MACRFKIRKNSFVHIFVKQVSSLYFVFELFKARFVYYSRPMLFGSADITMLFSTLTNCISTFASKISILSVLFYDSEFIAKLH